jgi:hypothetical protein
VGKRSDFDRAPRDFYRTPLAAVLPLVPFLKDEECFIEPCAGDGALVNAVESLTERADDSFVWARDAYDIEPQADFVRKANMFDVRTVAGALYIGNPPWRRDILHPLIEHLTSAPGSRCWLLFDADWIHTRQSVPYLPRLRKIVSVGRVKWIPDSKMTGKDNCAWHLFSQPSDESAQFYGRTK